MDAVCGAGAAVTLAEVHNSARALDYLYRRVPLSIIAEKNFSILCPFLHSLTRPTPPQDRRVAARQPRSFGRRAEPALGSGRHDRPSAARSLASEG